MTQLEALDEAYKEQRNRIMNSTGFVAALSRFPVTKKQELEDLETEYKNLRRLILENA